MIGCVNNEIVDQGVIEQQLNVVCCRNMVNGVFACGNWTSQFMIVPVTVSAIKTNNEIRIFFIGIILSFNVVKLSSLSG